MKLASARLPQRTVGLIAFAGAFFHRAFLHS
jgi:hypothetical protein